MTPAPAWRLNSSSAPTTPSGTAGQFQVRLVEPLI
jgi:hypothetical protein